MNAELQTCLQTTSANPVLTFQYSKFINFAKFTYTV